MRLVHRGDALLAPTVTKRLLEQYIARPRSANTPESPFAELTKRELEVTGALARGLSNAEIGVELFLSDATVKTHVTRILSKLGLRDRVQIVIAACESGLIRPGAGTG